MTPEQQKKAAIDFMLALDRGDEQALRNMTADHFKFELMTPIPGAPGPMDREVFLTTLPPMLKSLLPKGFNFKFGHAISEGPHVSMQGSCDTVTAVGKAYKNVYHWYFRFAGDKLENAREYLDSYHTLQAMSP
jgi:ketosteroid isomerase-like protein